LKHPVQYCERTLLLLTTSASDLSLRTIKCCSVVFGVTLKLIVTNTSSSSPAINKLRLVSPSTCHGTTASNVQVTGVVTNDCSTAFFTARPHGSAPVVSTTPIHNAQMLIIATYLYHQRTVSLQH